MDATPRAVGRISNIVGYGRKAMPYLFAFRGGDITQMIPAVTSQERCGTIANNRHINAKVGCNRKDLPPQNATTISVGLPRWCGQNATE